MAIDFNTSTITNKLIDSAVDYLGIPYNAQTSSPIHTPRQNSNFFYYRITSSKNGQFKSKLPSSLSMQLSSKFSSLVEGKLGIVSSINKLLQAGSAISGSTISLNTKYTTAQIWEGSSPVSISLPIELNAFNDVDEEVIMPMFILGSMVLPREGTEKAGSTGAIFNSLLRAPGPSPIDIQNDALVKSVVNSGIIQKAKSWASDMIKDTSVGNLLSGLSDLQAKDGGDNITVEIGSFLRFTRCIITDVKWDFDLTRLLSGSGKPLSVKGNVTFKTSYAMTTQDYEKALPTINRVTKAKHSATVATEIF